MTSTSYSPATTTTAATGRPATRLRGWALSGVVAGVCAVVGIQASMSVGAVYDPANAGDPDAVVAALADDVPAILVFHVTTMVAVVTLLVFAAGLHRLLAEQAPAGSLLPRVASSGLLLASVAGLVGTGLTTEFAFGLSQPDQLVPETAVLFGHWIGTMPWVWAGAGVAGVAVAVAGLRHAAVPRWLAWVSAVLGGVTLLFGISPLQYMAGFTGPVWVLVAALGLGLARGRS